jgi:hypothetical protein
MVQEWGKWSRSARSQGLELESLAVPEQVIMQFQRCCEGTMNRMANDLLNQGIPAALVDRISDLADLQRKKENLSNELQRLTSMRLLNPRTPYLPFFRLSQRFTYLMVLFCFVLALAGEGTFQRAWATPEWHRFIELGFSAISRLFSPFGLAALGSYILINLFLGFRFFNHYKKLLQRRSQKFIESLKMELGQIWDDALDEIVSQLARTHEKLKNQMNMLLAIQEGRRRE